MVPIGLAKWDRGKLQTNCFLSQQADDDCYHSNGTLILTYTFFRLKYNLWSTEKTKWKSLVIPSWCEFLFLWEQNFLKQLIIDIDYCKLSEMVLMFRDQV